MKTIAIILFYIFSSSTFSTNYHQHEINETFIGVYEGLTENMEFQFQSLDGMDYLFDEISDNIGYDLLDEKYIGFQFKVTWQLRNTEILDDEEEPTDDIEELKIITEIQKL